MPASSRIGDMFVGVCCCHPPIPCIGMAGLIVTGSPDTDTEESPQARVGDIGIGFCGHSTMIVAGSPTVEVNSRDAARVGDPVSGCITGAMVTGADTVKKDG